MTQPTLPTCRTHDLPPYWDGHAVLWDGWTDLPAANMFVCPPPKELTCCRACGSLASPLMKRGQVATSGIVTHARLVALEASRDRLPLESKGKLKRLSYYRLTAFRCPDCHFDQVSEDDGALWDLDESDYTD